MKIFKRTYKLQLIAACLLGALNSSAQNESDFEKPVKHFMPLYLDMPAEINVRKGYKEIDIAGGYADFHDFSGQRALMEFDFSPVNNLGFEIEVPFIFVQNKTVVTHTGEEDVIVPEEGGAPQSAMALRLGFNYTLASSKKLKTSLCAGYFNEFESGAFVHFGKPILEGNVANPFVAIAKVWGKRLHTMIYTGPAIQKEFEHNTSHTAYRFNTNLTYRFGKNEKENFVGVECNQTWATNTPGQMVLRPQVQFAFTENISLGLIGGVPVATANRLNYSVFARLIFLLK